MAEIEWLLAHARDYRVQLSANDEYELRALATRMQAERRVGRTQRESQKFVTDVLGTYRTPYGDLNQADISLLEAIRIKAVGAIAACRKHDSERCVCWRDAREELFELRRSGDKNPLGLAALALWNTLEGLARDRRDPAPPQPPPANLSPQQVAEITGTPQPVPYNWRYWKSPTYLEHVR